MVTPGAAPLIVSASRRVRGSTSTEAFQTGDAGRAGARPYQHRCAGAFWDMRAGGIRLGNLAAEQAQGPPTNPLEMANLDIATYVYHEQDHPNGRGGCRAFVYRLHLG